MFDSDVPGLQLFSGRLEGRLKGDTYPSETIQVLEGWSDKVLLTTNTTFDCEFFSFCKQTAATEPTLCHAVA